MILQLFELKFSKQNYDLFPKVSKQKVSKRCSGIEVAHKTKHTLKNVFGIPKDEIESSKKSEIYELRVYCKNGNEKYYRPKPKNYSNTLRHTLGPNKIL